MKTVCPTYLLLSHGRDDGNEYVRTRFKVFGNLFAKVAFGDFDVVLGDTVVGHEVEEAVVNVDLNVSRDATLSKTHTLECIAC